MFVIAKMPDGYTSEMEYNSKGEWRVCGCPVHEDNITYWMPLPKAGEDAFTELRTLLDKYESNASQGKLQQFDDGMLFMIRKIREVIE